MIRDGYEYAHVYVNARVRVLNELPEQRSRDHPTRVSAGMALLRYFNLNGDTGGMLPDPQGPLAKQVPSTSIMSANKEVKDVLAQGTKPTKRMSMSLLALAITYPSLVWELSNRRGQWIFLSAHFVQTRFAKNLHLQI